MKTKLLQFSFEILIKSWKFKDEEKEGQGQREIEFGLKYIYFFKQVINNISLMTSA